MIASRDEHVDCHLLQTICNNVPDLIWAKDLEHRYIFSNRANNETLLFPETPDEPLGKQHDFFAARILAERPDDPTWYHFSELCSYSDETTLAQQKSMQFQEYGLVRGELVFLDVYKAPLYDADGRLIGTFGSARVITRENLFEQDNARLAASVFENSNEGIAITDHDGKFISVNRAFCEITGYSAAEALGQGARLLKSGRHDRQFYQEMWDELLQTGQWKGEVWNRRKNGAIYPELLSITAVRDDSGAVKHYISVFSDISGIKQSQQQIEYLEWRDPLTDLANRRMFQTHLGQAIDLAKRRDQQLAILCLDLDHFKDINDSYGHLIGDELLCMVAKRLRDRMRSSDLVARLGGDEFVVLLEEVDHPELVSLVAEDIVRLFQESCVLDSGIELQTSASIGIALYPLHGVTPGDLLQQADAALYQAKQQGRSRFAFYSDDLTERALERINLGNYLRRAIEFDELFVMYQPQLDGETGAIIGAEALMRWQNQTLGMVSPVRFIPLAEELGCILNMGEWILRHVCLQGREWLDQGLPPVRLAVNISALQIRQPGFVEQIARILEVTGFPAHLLELELTESALMQHGDETVSLLESLKQLGVYLALDDFGTGYSSLAYLKHFPLDLLKIDKSFVDDIPNGVKDHKIVKAIIKMGQSLGFKLLAEGVEREEQRSCLAGLGCSSFQGYLFSKPLLADAFRTLLQQKTAEGRLLGK